jgi:hypothetical protein
MTDDQHLLSTTLELPATLFDAPESDYIKISVQPLVVFKAYYPSVSVQATFKFNREIEAFGFFARMNADFIPSLIDSGETNSVCWIAMPHAGVTLASWLESATETTLAPVIDQLLQIDAWLYKNDVNFLEASPKDILIDDHGKVRIIDFEYTFLNEPFEQILLERIDHDRLVDLPLKSADMARDVVQARKNQSVAYYRRKIRSAILLRCGRSRVQKSIRPQ